MSRTRSAEAIGAAVTVGETICVTPRTLFRRWLDAFIESRMRKAEREIREHLKSISDEALHRAGYRRRAPRTRHE